MRTKPATLPDALLDGLVEATAAEAPAPASAQRMRERILDRVRQAKATTGLLTTIRAGEGGWQELLPKIHAKLVHTDGQAQSYLVRLEPGAVAPAHPHPNDEECLVLEGELDIGDIHLRAGDYHVARGGAQHGETVSRSGCLLYLRYAQPIEDFFGRL